jgi:hypothetical protein
MAITSPSIAPPQAVAILILVSGVACGAVLGSARLASAPLDPFTRGIVIAYLIAVAGAGLYWMWYGFTRRQAVENVPTAKIASAALGHVELSGEALWLGQGAQPQSPSGKSCLWYRAFGGEGFRFGVEVLLPLHLSDPGDVVPLMETAIPFGLRDETGAAIVFPYGATIIGSHTASRRTESGWFREVRIDEGDRVYVLGELSASEPDFHLEAAASEKLRAWRENPLVRARFDNDGDGRIASDEDWRMRLAALVEAEREAAAARADYRQVHLVSKPADGRRFVISNRSQAAIVMRSRAWELAGVAAFLSGAIAVGWCFTAFTN